MNRQITARDKERFGSDALLHNPDNLGRVADAAKTDVEVWFAAPRRSTKLSKFTAIN